MNTGDSELAPDNLFDRKRTLYIGNLFFDVTENDLVKEFARFGTVTKVKIVRDSRGLSKGLVLQSLDYCLHADLVLLSFAYIDYSTQEAADTAMERLNMQLFEGRRITVQYAARPSSPADPERRGHGRTFDKPRNSPSKTLFIGNMSFEMTDRDLSNLFRGIRNVVDVRVAIDRRTGQPRGFAHADFIDVKSAMDAMQLLSEKEIYGRKLRVDYSFSSANRAPRNEPSEPSDESAPQ
jgi:RNA recognition motif-containing protein